LPCSREMSSMAAASDRLTGSATSEPLSMAIKRPSEPLAMVLEAGAASIRFSDWALAYMLDVQTCLWYSVVMRNLGNSQMGDGNWQMR
jgi:hypothetical protein